MLSKVIVNSYATLIEVSLWLVLISSVIGGWQAGGFFGAVAGLVFAFVFGAMFLGAFLVLEDIRKFVKAIESKRQT